MSINIHTNINLKKNTETYTPFYNTPPTGDHRYATHRMRNWKHVGEFQTRFLLFLSALLHMTHSESFLQAMQNWSDQSIRLSLAVRNLFHCHFLTFYSMYVCWNGHQYAFFFFCPWLKHQVNQEHNMLSFLFFSVFCFTILSLESQISTFSSHVVFGDIKINQNQINSKQSKCIWSVGALLFIINNFFLYSKGNTMYL